MAAVSRDYLNTLKALTHQPYDRAVSEATMVSRIQEGIPGWTAAPADVLRRALPLMAEILFLHGETENTNFQMGQMVNAEGLYLDVFGVERNVLRRTGENDEDYLLRLANSGQSRTLGTLPSTESQATDFNPMIVDVQAVTKANRQDINLYALKASHTALTSAENAALLNHLNLRGNKMGGVDVALPAVTLAAFTIDVTIRHRAETSADTVSNDARTAIYAWLAANQRIGEPVYRSAIIGAAFVPGAVDVSLTSPAADLAGTAGTARTCASNETDVVIRTVVV